MRRCSSTETIHRRSRTAPWSCPFQQSRRLGSLFQTRLHSSCFVRLHMTPRFGKWQTFKQALEVCPCLFLARAPVEYCHACIVDSIWVRVQSYPLETFNVVTLPSNRPTNKALYGGASSSISSSIDLE